MPLSQAEENYLKAIYHLTLRVPVATTNAVAERLSTKPASVTDMLRRLAAKGLVDYLRYQGAGLTDEGRQCALRVVRKHRLWETFLVEKLGFAWDEVHEVAEQLEHIYSPRLIERLDVFLGHPQFDPHGDPIPDAAGRVPAGPRLLLSNLAVGRAARIVGVRESSPAFLQHLDQLDLRMGRQVEVLEKFPYDASARIRVDAHAPRLVSREVSENLYLTVE